MGKWENGKCSLILRHSRNETNAMIMGWRRADRSVLWRGMTDLWGGTVDNPSAGPVNAWLVGRAYGSRSCFSGADADCLFHWGDENFSIADFGSIGGLANGLDD